MHVRPPFVVNEILPQVECAFAIASLDRRANSPRSLSLERSELARRLEEPSAARTRRLSLAQRELALSLRSASSPFWLAEGKKTAKKNPRYPTRPKDIHL